MQPLMTASRDFVMLMGEFEVALPRTLIPGKRLEASRAKLKFLVAGYLLGLSLGSAKYQAGE